MCPGRAFLALGSATSFAPVVTVRVTNVKPGTEVSCEFRRIGAIHSHISSHTLMRF